jgi:hypothetical protein
MSDSNGKDKAPWWLANLAMQPQYFIFVLTSIIRVTKYWHAGQFNPKFAPRSWSYFIKIFL